MPDTYEIHLVSDDALWDALVQQALGGTIFSTSAWLNCAARATDGEAHRIGCFRNGNLIAGLSGLARKRSGLNRLETPELTPHTGSLAAGAGRARWVPARGGRPWRYRRLYLACHVGDTALPGVSLLKYSSSTICARGRRVQGCGPSRAALQPTWIEKTYHRRRRQARLGRMTPIEFEAVYAIQQVALAA